MKFRVLPKINHPKEIEFLPTKEKLRLKKEITLAVKLLQLMGFYVHSLQEIIDAKNLGILEI